MRIVPAALAVAAFAVVAAGCGGSGGSATVWVTRDEGHSVLVQRHVPAGLTAIQALERVAKVSTRYGGRFVQSIDGISGSRSARQDWFYFVNGIEADRSAAEYRLHKGDVEWWDYRSWSGAHEHVPIVVGAFPEPFVHGYDGNVRPAVVVGSGPGARRVARMLHARVVHGAPPRDANVFRIVGARGNRLVAHQLSGGGFEFDFNGDVGRLMRDPSLYRFHYSVP